jgi:hypothetical protein
MARRLAIAVLLIVVSMPPGTAQNQQSMFVFQNNFWLNLHQFLRGEVFRQRTNRPLGIDPASLSDAERAAWTSALEVYTDVAKSDLIFDENARRIANTLAMAGDVARLSDGVLDAPTIGALNAASSIYRARLWSARQRENEAWSTNTKALVVRHETAMASALAKAYGTRWPREPYLVDVVGEIGPNSAVTHEGPAGFAAHIQASTGSPRNTGDAPLELIFHEASHVAMVGGRITRMIEDESTRQKLATPPDLWHFTIMFTSGALARRELADTGRPGYVPYVDRYDMLPAATRAAFERAWLPYLNGRSRLAEALHDLVRDAR